MPIDIIEKSIGMEIDEGDVVLSWNAERHARRRHPDDYDRWRPYLEQTISDPHFIGDDYWNQGKIELIRRVSRVDGGVAVLVAVNVEIDRHGDYHIASFYPISEAKLQSRLDKKFTVRV